MNPRVQASKGQVFEHTLEEFVNVTKSDEVASLITKIRETEDKDERRRLKSQLPFRCPHYFRFRDNHRAQDAILPEEFTFQTCVDIDDVEQVEPALSLAYLLNQEKGQWQGMLLHTEHSASKKLHLDIRIAISKVPGHCRAAMAHAIFPAWATRMGGVKLEYADNSEMEGTMMNVLVAPMSTGKSCIKKPIDICLKDIIARDALCRQQEQEWKDEQNSKSANKKGTLRPTDICIQVNDSDMTNAAFTQRLADADRAGHKYALVLECLDHACYGRPLLPQERE